MSRMKKFAVMMWLVAVCMPFFGVHAQAGEPQVRVLEVTRGDYGGANDLSPGPESDGVNFERVIRKAYGSQVVSLVRKGKEGVTTVAGVEAAIRSAFADSTDDDINYFYYSGHGKSTGLYLSSSAVMTATELAISFEGIKGTNILVMDCCYSGSMASRSVETVSGSEQFLDDFVAEFQDAAALLDEQGSMKARSALTNSRFKLLLASSEEELSWQMGYEELEEVYLGGFTTTLSFGCGIDPRLVSENANYELDVVSADYDMNGEVSMSEISRYIQNTYHYAMNHVRVYPENDDSVFLPVDEAVEPYMTFDRAKLGTDENGAEELQISYRAASKGKVDYAIYCDTTYNLSLLPYNDLEYASRLQTYTNIQQIMAKYNNQIKEVTMDGDALISIPLEDLELDEGNYLVVLQTQGQKLRYMIPFSIARTENEDLADAFMVYFTGNSYVAREGLYEAEEGKELGIQADFGTTNNSEIACPYLTCNIYDSEGTIVRHLADRELMEVIPTKFVGSTNKMSEGNCYRIFYWDGKDDEGNPVPDGTYEVIVQATGAVEDEQSDTIKVQWKSEENTGKNDTDPKETETESENSRQTESETKPEPVTEPETEPETQRETLDPTNDSVLELELSKKRLLLPLEDGETGVEILFSIPKAGKVDLDVIRIAGGKEETVRKMLTGQSVSKQNYRISWDGIVDGRTNAEAGIYIFELRYTDGETGEQIKERSEQLQVVRSDEPMGKEKPDGPERNEVSAGTGQNTAVVQPSQVTLSVGTKTLSKATIGVKEKVQLTASLLPAGSQGTVTYSSSNDKVATVSASGQIVGKKAGKAVITATTSNGKTASVTVTVKNAPKKITLSAKKKTLKVGKTFKVKVKFPAKTASYKITYTSSKKSVATVDATGKIKALKKGKAVITAKTFNGKKAKITITVK